MALFKMTSKMWPVTATIALLLTKFVAYGGTPASYVKERAVYNFVSATFGTKNETEVTNRRLSDMILPLSEAEGTLQYERRLQTEATFSPVDVCTNVVGGTSSTYPCICGATTAAATQCSYGEMCTASTDSDGVCQATTPVNSMSALRSALADPSIAAIRLEKSGTPYCCGQISIDRDVTIVADVAGAVVIDGRGVNQGWASGGLMKIAVNVSVNLHGLVLTGGTAYAAGGILNSGTLKMHDCTVTNNVGAWNGRGGGGISNAGLLIMHNSKIVDNSISTARKGGAGIFNTGIMKLYTCSFIGNTINAEFGSAIQNFDNTGNSMLRNVTFVDNTAPVIWNSGVLAWECDIGSTRSNSAVQTGNIDDNFASCAVSTPAPTLKATCTAVRMVCPLPSILANMTYRVFGSLGDGQCQQNGSSVDFEKPACNVTRSFDHSRGVVVDSVLLTPVVTTTSTASPSGFVFLEEPPAALPHFHCVCESPIVASAGNDVGAELYTAPPSELISIHGSNAFAPRLKVFKDKAFQNPLETDEQFPVSSERFYIEIDSPYHDDVVGAINCTASPTADVNGPNASRFLHESCASGAFDVRFHEATEQNVVRLSTRKFVHPDAVSIYLNCAVRRCAEVPCGVCGERRLAEAGAKIEDEVVMVAAQVRLQGDQVPKATAAVITATTQAPNPVSNIGVQYIVSGAFFVAMTDPSQAIDEALAALEEALAKKIALTLSVEDITKDSVSVSVSRVASSSEGRFRRLSTGIHVEYTISPPRGASAIEQVHTAAAVVEKINSRSQEALTSLVTTALHIAAVNAPSLALVKVHSVTVKTSAWVDAKQGPEEVRSGMPVDMRTEVSTTGQMSLDVGGISASCKMFDLHARYILVLLFLFLTH